MIERPSDPATIARLRGLCLAFPDVTEKLSHGESTWFARGRSFAMTADHHHDHRLAVWRAAPAGRPDSLIETDPGAVLLTAVRRPSPGGSGCTSMSPTQTGKSWRGFIAEGHGLVAGSRNR